MAKTKIKNPSKNVLDRKLTISEGVIWREIDKDRLSILRISDSSIFQIDGMAKSAWRMMNGKKPLKAILKTVEKSARVADGEFEKDFLVLVKSLVKEKLVEG